ncbi:hypothetical protein GCM10020000_75540 [Streptomyces olivoverticillatus]
MLRHDAQPGRGGVDAGEGRGTVQPEIGHRAGERAAGVVVEPVRRVGGGREGPAGRVSGRSGSGSPETATICASVPDMPASNAATPLSGAKSVSPGYWRRTCAV